jgi:hypothetical protein
MAELLLLHVPAGVLFNVVVVPVHTESVPVITEGIGFTEIVFIAVQPVARVYVQIVVPGPDTPVTRPVPVTTVAAEGLLLLHVPPPGVLPKLIFAASQTTEGPLMAVGNELTKTTVVR